MIDSVALIAPGSPPETGASTKSTPSFSRRWAHSLESSGETLEVSQTIVPAFSAEASPFSPKITSLTIAAFGRLSKITSQFAATS